MNEMETHQGIASRITAVSHTIDGMQTTLDQLSSMLTSVKREMAHLQQTYRLMGPDLVMSGNIPTFRTMPTKEHKVHSRAQVSLNRVKKLISDAFVTWCRTGDVMIHKYRHFEKILQQYLPGASVIRVFRDLSNPAYPIAFYEKERLKSPAEYWMVVSAYEKTLYVLPRPMDTENFRDISQVFAGGRVGPGQLGAIDPAVVQRSGNQIVLREPGKLVTL